MKIARIVGCLFLLAASLLTAWPSLTVLAQEETIEPKVVLGTTYPKIENTYAGSNFEFVVDITYTTNETNPRVFDLRVTSPSGWTSYITPQYESTRISAIKIQPSYSPDKVKVVVTPPVFPASEPGEYEITLEVSSGTIKGSIQLTAVVTATYSLALTPTTQRYNTTATAGKDSVFSMVAENTGSANITGIKFSSSKPEGWAVDFKPEKVDSLAAGGFQTIDVAIKPGAKTIAGDYQISLIATSTQASRQIDVRVTVETPTIWGWLGVVIIVVVIAGVAYAFMRFSRR